MRRKISRTILILLIVMLAISAAGIHFVIEYTDLPRQITEKSLSEKLQTDVSIEELKTSWPGKSRLENIRINLPKDERSFVNIKSMDVRHNNIPSLLITRDPGINIVKAEGVTFHVNPKKGGTVAEEKVFPVENVEIRIFNNKAEYGKAQVIQANITQPDIGKVNAFALIENDQINLNVIEGKLLNGEFSGSVCIHTDNFAKTRMTLTWNDVDLFRLRKWQPEVERFLNFCSGQLEVKPSDQKNPLEPLEYDLTIEMAGDSILKKLDIDQLNMSGFAGPKRVLLTDFKVPMFGGVFKTNARISKKSEGFFLYSKNRFEQLDVKQIADKFTKNKDADVYGKLEGIATVMTSFKIQDLSGTVDLKLTESNLADSQFMRAISDILNLRFRKAEPEGYGSTELSFQGGKINISDFYYYNSGLEIRGTGIIDDLLQGGKSPVEGVVMATARPLKETDLPGTNTLDKYLYLIQQDMTAVKVDGTVSNVDVKVIALPEVKAALNKIIGSN